MAYIGVITRWSSGDIQVRRCLINIIWGSSHTFSSAGGGGPGCLVTRDPGNFQSYHFWGIISRPTRWPRKCIDRFSTHPLQVYPHHHSDPPSNVPPLRNIAGLIKGNGRLFLGGYVRWGVGWPVMTIAPIFAGKKYPYLVKTKLMLMSINFTLKTSHSCQLKCYTMLHYVFQVGSMVYFATNLPQEKQPTIHGSLNTPCQSHGWEKGI